MTTMRWNHFVCPHYHTSGECGTDRLSTPSVTNLGYRPKAIQHQKSIRGARNSNWLEKYMGCRPVNRDDAEAKQRYRSDRMARQQINPRCSSGTVASVRAVVQKASIRVAYTSAVTVFEFDPAPGRKGEHAALAVDGNEGSKLLVWGLHKDIL
jgi:hypothetical protein